MTTIATKAGAVILKQGMAAESCACCGQACTPGSPLVPGTHAASIVITLSNIVPAAGGLSKLQPSQEWLQWRTDRAQGDVSTPVWLNFNAGNNLLYDIQYETMQQEQYGGELIREFSPVWQTQDKRCLFRNGMSSVGGTYSVRATVGDGGWIFPAMQANWTLQDGVFVYVIGTVTGALNFVPPGMQMGNAAQPRATWVNRFNQNEQVTVGGFNFQVGFPYRGIPDSQTFAEQQSLNLFSSTSQGTSYFWKYDVTVSMSQ